jgi:hypothetical protein
MADYINGMDGQNTCALNHPLCEQCIHGLWKSPTTYLIGDDMVMGCHIRFSKHIIKCPMCNQQASYSERNTGKPVQYKGKSLIHGVIEWKNHDNLEDTMYQYIAGKGMELVWAVMQNLFGPNYNLRPKARDVAKKQLTKM